MATLTENNMAARAAQPLETVAAPTCPAESLSSVELIGFVDAGPAGFVRLFQEPTRLGLYADIELRNVIRLFPEVGVDLAAGQTVIAVHGEAEILICTPVQAARIGDNPSVELFWPRR